MEKTKRKIFVGLSGGVDSSVSAALLKKDGYDVTGVFIKVWQADFLPCNWREERRDAMRVAAALDIPFLTLDLEKAYKEEVVDYMIREYGAGRVPNPDVMCNKHVKFGAFLEFAKKNGADLIATGHYARIDRTLVLSGLTSKYVHRLLKGVDPDKDQSYFLWTLTQEQLSQTLFPVGHLQKSEVRKLARKWGLPNADKKDSQGLCFMGKIDIAEFLKHYLRTERGAVLDVTGSEIGEHDGAMLYTIGQRHGFSVKRSSPNEAPFFVIAKDVARNTVTVGHREDAATYGARSSVALGEVNIISGRLNAEGGMECLARTRYRGELQKARWEVTGEGTARVMFADPAEDIAAGQSLVAYDGEECLGGGVVSS